jgi:hypothetical protein
MRGIGATSLGVHEAQAVNLKLALRASREIRIHQLSFKEMKSSSLCIRAEYLFAASLIAERMERGKSVVSKERTFIFGSIHQHIIS